MQEFHPVSILLMVAKAHIMKLALEGKRKIFCRTKRHDLHITLKKLTLKRKAGQTAFLLEGGVWTPRWRATISAGLPGASFIPHIPSMTVHSLPLPTVFFAEPQFPSRCSCLGPLLILTLKALILSWYAGALRARVKAFSMQLNAACGIIVLSET